MSNFIERLETRRLMHDDANLSADTFGVSAGASDYVDSTGFTWEDARGFSTSSTQQVLQTHNTIANTGLQPLFNTTLQDFNLKWSSSVPDGTYAVSLLFAEQRSSGVGNRVFSVDMEGNRVLNNFSIDKAAGGLNKAVTVTFNVIVSDGTLNINFVTGAFRASINAIKVEAESSAPTGPTTPTGGPTGGSFNPGAILWSTKASDPQKREEAEGFVARGKLYVVGGYVDNAFHATTQVDTYDPATNTWNRLHDAPTKITHTGLAVDASTGDVWMCGGFIGDFPAPQGTNIVWKYDTNSDTWSRGPDLPESRGSGGAAIVGHKLYYISGATADRQADSGKCWVLDLNNTAAGWTSFSDIPHARNHFGYAAVDGKIYVFGGQNLLEDKGVTLGTGSVYDPATDTWSAVPPMQMPYSHFSFTTGVYKGRYILMAGGENPHNTAKDYVLAFDTVTRQWATLTHLPNTARAASGGIVGDTYVVSGGYRHSAGQFATTWTADLTKLGL